MKKNFSPSISSLLIFMAILSGGTIALSGCSGSSDKNIGNIIQHQPQDKRIGLIQSLGGFSTSSQGTHLLKLHDGNSILLRSDAVDLDDVKFKDKKVEIGGLLTYTKDNQQIMDVRNIDILDLPPVEETVATSRKSYINSSLGIKLQYRTDFFVNYIGQTNEVQFFRPLREDLSSATNTASSSTTESGSSAQSTATTQSNQNSTVSTSSNSSTASESVADSSTPSALSSVFPGDKKGHLISISRLLDVSTREKYLEYLKTVGIQSTSTSDLLTAGFTKSIIGLESLNAFKKTSIDGQNIEFYIDGTDKFYHLTFTGGSDSQLLEDQNLFYEMVNSFHILTAAEIEAQGTAVNGSESLSSPTVESSSQTPSSSSLSSSASPASATNNNQTSPNSSLSFDGSEALSAPSSSSVPANSNGELSTPELKEGYTVLESASSKFSLQYPKGWYFGVGTSTDPKVSRHYDFGNKPVDEVPGTVSLDILSGSLPAGTVFNSGSREATKLMNGDLVEIYVKGSGSRIYRVSGPQTQESALTHMADTLRD